MRRFPLSLVVVSAIGVVLWVLTSFLTASYLQDRVVLANLTVVVFLSFYRIALASAAVAGLAGTLTWLVYGSRPARALELDRARRKWMTLWFAELLASAGVVIVMVIRLIAESLSPGNLAFLFLMMSLHTWIFFWVCSLLFSPRTVERLPWLAR